MTTEYLDPRVYYLIVTLASLIIFGLGFIAGYRLAHPRNWEDR